MADHPNAQIMRRAYQAFSDGDIASLKELIAEDATWHVPGRSPLSGEYQGQEEILGFFGKLKEMSNGTFRVEQHDVTASDEHAVNLDRISGKRGDKELGMNMALVAHIRGGKIAEAWDVFSDQYGWDEFWT